jgi:hypothetical protein
MEIFVVTLYAPFKIVEFGVLFLPLRWLEPVCSTAPNDVALVVLKLYLLALLPSYPAAPPVDKIAPRPRTGRASLKSLLSKFDASFLSYRFSVLTLLEFFRRCLPFFGACTLSIG